MDATDTIFALSSGAGMAAIAVVRLSGRAVRGLLERCAPPLPKPRMASLRWIIDPHTGERIDQGLVLWLPGPGTATGEDCCELHLHGGRATVEAALSMLGKCDGARPALAGEFTRRAFSNGRLNLFEAEALADLIHASSDAQRKQALALALGGDSGELEAWRTELSTALALAEAMIDFADDDETVIRAGGTLAERIRSLTRRVELALERSAKARVLREGVKLVIAGPPNAGKSSLLNRLAGRAAAIVSPRPGTTRDVIEVQMVLGGVPVLVSDTAGQREAAEDDIEAEGVSRARAAMEEADIVLWVTAADAEATPPAGIAGKLIRVRNKCDKAIPVSGLIRNENAEFAVSALTGEGVDTLAGATAACAAELTHTGYGLAFARERQISCAHSLSIHLRNILERPGLPAEVLAEELRAAALDLGRITGRIDVEDLLDTIFREFCIGK